MEIDYRFEDVSGHRAESFFAIGLRFDAEYDHHDSYESWCVHVTPDRMTISNGQASYFTDIWESPDGSVFISDGSGTVFRNANPVTELEGWSTDVLDASLTGIWGLRSDFVLSWGGPAKRIFRWNGRDWSEMPSPGGWIRNIAGQDDHNLFAVGHEGLLSRWDGTKWTRIPYPDVTMSSIAVVDGGQQIYAAGPGGELLEGSEHGLSKLLHHDFPILSLAWWKGELWVGAGNGLHKLVDGRLEAVKPNIIAYDLDARGDLIIGTDAYAAHTRDGAAFSGHSVLDFGALRAGYAALWAPNLPIDIDHGKR